jgi:NADH-ubiquinone oxidoreductase chain 4
LVILSLWISSLILISRIYIINTKNNFNLFILFVISLNVILIIAFSTSNLFSFYLFFEASLIPTLFLILGWGYQPERLQAGVYLILYTVCARLPLLISISLIFNIQPHSKI